MQKILEKIKQEPTIFMFRKLWQFTEGRHGQVMLVLILLTIAYGITLLEPLILAEVLNEIQRNGVTADNLPYILSILSLTIVLTFVFGAFHGTARILQSREAFRARVSQRGYFLKGLMALSIGWHADKDSGEIIDKVSKSSAGILRFTNNMHRIIRTLVRILGSVVVLAFFNLAVALAAFILSLVTIGVLVLFDRKLMPQWRALNKFENKVAGGVFDALSNIASIIILHVQNPIWKQLEKRIWNPFSLFVQSAKLNELKWFSGGIAIDFVVLIPIAIFLVYGVQNNLAIQVGTISALYMYLQRITDAFFELGFFYGEIAWMKTSMQNAEEVEAAIEANNKTKRPQISEWDALTIHNLNFSYDESLRSKAPQSESKQLNDVTMAIQRGERIACIGESGSGKTTFLKVLHGLYDTASARVSFGMGEESPRPLETSFADIDLGTMLVPQEPEVFSSTIKENITLGLGYKDEEIERVMQLAQFSDVVDKLPKGLKSVINEKGVNLSGGQKQRLALARALLFAQDKEIILLDESTSSVDPENEVKIYENIFKEFQGKTILASIHKMNLLKYFDRIVMFADGKIADEGTFDELLQKNRQFKLQWEEFVKQSQ